MTTNTRSPRQVFQSPTTKVPGHVQSVCMLSSMKSHNHCDPHMDVKKERKSTFFTNFENRDKEDRSLFTA